MPRNYAVKPLPCGVAFCPSALRILWPDLAFGHAQIAAIYGVVDTMIPRRAEKIGIINLRPQVRRKAKYSRKKFEAIWTDLTITRREAAERIGLHPAICTRHAKRMGIKPRPSGCRTISYPEDFTAMWQAGVSTSEIAQACKCHPDTVGNEAARRKLKGRTPHFRALMTMQEYRLLKAMRESARITQMAFEITGREPRRHFAEIKRLAA